MTLGIIECICGVEDVACSRSGEWCCDSVGIINLEFEFHNFCIYFA